MRGLASCFKSGTNLIGEGNNEKPGEESQDFSPGSFFVCVTWWILRFRQAFFRRGGRTSLLFLQNA